MDVKTATVTELPNCDFCKMDGKEEPAEYDGKTVYGAWANMCQAHFDKFGVGLGTGRGQKLVLPTKQPDDLIAKADSICEQCGLGCSEDSWNKTEGRFRLVGNPDKVAVMVALGLYCEEMDVEDA